MPETKTLIYEWDAEEWSGPESDPDAECLEHYHSETFAETWTTAQQLKARGAVNVRIVLVRDDTTRGGGRSWAYLDERCFLPSEFTEPDAEGRYVANGVRVPLRFHAEVARQPKVSL